MSRLTITDRRERALVHLADALLAPVALTRLGHTRPASPRRIVCLRLERMGDLLMTAPAISDLKRSFPNASIDIVVGSWNRDLAAALPGVDRVETLDGSWLSRNADGRGVAGLVRVAARWRSRRYDLAINFEPDIRSNLVLAAIGARWAAGYASGGGGALLDTALDYDVLRHTSDNARALVRAVARLAGSEDPAYDDESRDAGHAVRPSGDAGRVFRPEGAGRVFKPEDVGPVFKPGDVGRVFRPGGTPGLDIPQASRDEAARLLSRFDGSPRIGVHVSGGRAIKQWPETRFRELAERLVRDRGAAIVLTGAPSDRTQIDVVRAALPDDRVLDLSNGVDAVTVGAVLEQIDLFVTGDTGPMHLAHAVGTPIVAVFGPSDPVRYAPRGLRDRVVRVDLSCSPCNRIRVPPARCAGHTPDCLAAIDVETVLAAIHDVLDQGRR